MILILEQPDDVSLQQLQEIIMHRIPAVPRLRQRLIKLPLDCGRPVWIDDHEFDIDHHVRAVSCPSPGDERALLDTALSVIMEPLSRERPLWSVVQITDLADGASAVVFVLHHVFADGAGGLNILAALSDSDPGAPSAAPPFPRQSPSRPSLVVMRGKPDCKGYAGRPDYGGVYSGACPQVVAFTPRERRPVPW